MMKLLVSVTTSNSLNRLPQGIFSLRKASFEVYGKLKAHITI
jgi:hypothetical protein